MIVLKVWVIYMLFAIASGVGIKADVFDGMSADNVAITDSLLVHFRQDKTVYESNYLGNAQTLGQVLATIDSLGPQRLESVDIIGYASPEGATEYNAGLSRKRSEVVYSQVKEIAPDWSKGKISVKPGFESWDLLKERIQSDEKLTEANRNKIIDILDAQGIGNDTKKWRLKNKLGTQPDLGDLWQYILQNHYLYLRCVIIRIRYNEGEEIVVIPETPPTEPEEPQPEPVIEPKDTVVVTPPTPEPEKWKKRTVVALKTNALYDAITVPNYAIEVPIGKNFSAQFEHYYAWWATKPELKYCLQYFTLGGEFRWWFAPQPRPETDSRMLRDVLTGHFVGVYALYCKTDLQWERLFGMYQCHPVWSAGLSYGYSFPVSKHWNMELSATAGYARIPYRHYIPSDDWLFLWKDRENQGVLHYFGPTQVKVSLVRPIVIKYRDK